MTLAQPEKTGGNHASRLGAFVRDYWLLAIALHPLARTLILLVPPSGATTMQVAERFLWFSFWLVEAAVIAVAFREGFRALPGFRALHPAVRMLAVIWIVAMAIGTIGATFGSTAFRSAAIWLLHGVFALAAWHLVRRGGIRFEHAFDRFSVALACAATAAGMLVMIEVYSSGYPFAPEISGFSHIRHSGYVFGPAIALCLGRLATVPHSTRTTMALLVANIALCLWFGSRGPFFGLIVGLAVACALFAEFRRRAFWLRSASAALAGAVLSVVVPSPDNAAYNAIRRFFHGSTDPEEFTSGRTAFWMEAIRLITDRPLFGYGGEQFQYVSPLAANTYRHPHQLVLQAVFEWGLIGGGAFLALLALWAMAVWRGRRGASAGGRVAVVSTVFMIAYAALDGILFYPFTIGLVAILMVTALALSGAGVPRNASIRGAAVPVAA